MFDGIITAADEANVRTNAHPRNVTNSRKMDHGKKTIPKQKTEIRFRAYLLKLGLQWIFIRQLHTTFERRFNLTQPFLQQTKEQKAAQN